MKVMSIFLWILVSLFFGVSIGMGESRIITNDYTDDPQLIIVKDKSGEKDIHGNISGAFYSLPATEYKSFTQEFEVYFKQISYYSQVSIGLSSREHTGDIKIAFGKADDDRNISGMRGGFLFQTEDNISVNAVPEVSFDEGRTYHIRMRYQEGEYVQVVVSGKDEEGLFQLWDSGKLKVVGKASFNRVYFGVRTSVGSDIHYDKDLKHIYLRGVGDVGYSSTVFVDNMVIKYGE